MKLEFEEGYLIFDIEQGIGFQRHLQPKQTNQNLNDSRKTSTEQSNKNKITNNMFHEFNLS